MTLAAKQLAPLTLPMSELLTNLAQELERMRALGMRVELSMCQMAVSASAEGEWMEDVQQLDLLLQQAAALRDFASTLARAQGADVKIDAEAALAQITLGDVRQRLAGETATESDDGLMFFDGSGSS